MTSPALRTMTVSPGRTSLWRTWSWLCSVARPTVEPPTKTGSSTANGVALPVRPIETWMSRRMVVRSSGGSLNAIAQRGALAVVPERLLHREVVDLHHDAVDLVGELVAVLDPVTTELVHRVEVVERLRLRVHREPERAQPLERARVAGGASAPTTSPSW